MKKLISIGECMIEMSALENGLYKKGYAGDSLNMAFYARQFLSDEFEVDYFTAVGGDAPSEEMVQSIANHGIGTQSILRIDGKSPGLYLINLLEGERTFSYWRSHSAARELASDEQKLRVTLIGENVLFFSGISLAILHPATRDRFLSVIQTAKSAGQMVVFDSNLRPSLWQSTQEMADWTQKAAQVSSIAVPTVPDEYALFDEKSSEHVVERYLKAGCIEVVVKAGPEKALISTPSGDEWVGPEAPITPIDTTGAGDSFNGSYIAARMEGKAAGDAAKFAHRVAGQVIQKRGALVPDIKNLV